MYVELIAIIFVLLNRFNNFFTLCIVVSVHWQGNARNHSFTQQLLSNTFLHAKSNGFAAIL